VARLALRPLEDVQSVNDFEYATEVHAGRGDQFDFYFQLVDLEKMRAREGVTPPGLRYVPASGATLMATFLNVRAASEFSRPATQPFAQDPSIWRLSILSTDPLLATVQLRLRLTEGSSIRTVVADAIILIDGDEGTC
jgi:hypothetical protein